MLRRSILTLRDRMYRVMHYALGPSRRARATAAQLLSGRPYYELYDDCYRLLDSEGLADRSFIGVVNARRDMYDAWERLRRAGLLPDPDPGVTLIDLGCGEGDNAAHFADLGYHVTGVDVSLTAIAHAEQVAAARRLTASFRAENVLQLADTPDATYHAAVDVGCLHMLVRGADRRAYLATVRRVLRPGGAFFLFDRVTRHDVVVADEEEYILRSISLVETRRTADGAKFRTHGFGFRGASLRQYRAELAAAGFEVRHAERRGGFAVLVARTPCTDGMM